MVFKKKRQRELWPEPERPVRSLFDDPRLLQQVLGYLGADHGSGGRELHLQVFAEAAGVIVDGGAGIAEGLHERVQLQDLLSQGSIVSLTEATRRFR